MKIAFYDVAAFDLQGRYSRRITEEDRLIYKVEADTIIITSCKGHYGDK
jgi:toxin YoeB